MLRLDTVLRVVTFFKWAQLLVTCGLTLMCKSHFDNEALYCWGRIHYTEEPRWSAAWCHHRAWNQQEEEKRTGARDLTQVHRVITGVWAANGEANGLIVKSLTWEKSRSPKGAWISRAFPALGHLIAGFRTEGQRSWHTRSVHSFCACVTVMLTGLIKLVFTYHTGVYSDVIKNKSLCPEILAECR